MGSVTGGVGDHNVQMGDSERDVAIVLSGGVSWDEYASS
jgi:hypothetical protein